MTWQQIYDPFNSRLLSTLVSALPVLTLFFVLVGLKKRVWISALSGLMMAVALALLVFKMPAVLVVTAAGHGFIFGLLRIAWIVVGSIFLYNVASETGQFQVMKDSIAGLSSDKRLQLVLIAFCFGAFLEGTGGGGAPVAIAGAFLMGLGFSPFQSATLCLLANTAPVAWGGVGNPIRTLGGVTGLPELQFSAMAGRILPPLSLILPFWLVRSMVSWRETFQVWPALLVSGLSFAGMQFYWSNYQDIGLVDVVSAIFSLLVTVAFLKFWKPATGNPCQWRVGGHSQTAFCGPGIERVVAFHRRFDFDFHYGSPVDGEIFELRCAEDADAVLAQRCFENAADRAEACAGGRYGQPELCRHSRHRRLRCGTRHSVIRRFAGIKNLPPVQGDRVANDAIAAGHQLYGRARVRNAILRHGYHHGPESDGHRKALSVLRHAARLARRGINRHRRGIERPLRQPAKGHGTTVGPESHPDGSCEFDWRRDGQDD